MRRDSARSLTLAVLAAVAVAFVSGVFATEVAESSRSYLGEPAPGSTPVVFRPGVVSGDGIEIALAVHPDEAELYVTRITSGKATLLVSRKTGGVWRAIEPVSFASAYDDAGAFVTADGWMLYFASKRPGIGETTPRGAYHIWLVTRQGETWSEPAEVVLPLESVSGEASPSLTLDGALYYAADYTSLGGEGVYCSSLVDGVWQMPEYVGVFPHDGAVYVEPFIAADGSFLLFYCAGRPDNLAPASTLGDLYVSFRTDDGAWTPPCNPGSPVNSAMEESSPSLSSDGRFLFFASNRAARNRMPDIYWVSADFLAALKP
jgi:hypothetical protein